MDEIPAGRRLDRRRWRKALMVEERIKTWAWLVSAVETGYDDIVEEYTNDLYCRNWIHEEWPLLDDDLRGRWDDQLASLDDRFRAATVDDGGAVMAQVHGGGYPELWWWRRYPRVLTGDLGESLRAVGAV